MKQFMKQNLNQILFVILLGLIFLLWGRVLLRTFLQEGNTKHLTDTTARVRCVQAYGWEVDPFSETEQYVYIPKTFDKNAQAYQHLQTLCGFDLTPFRGSSVACYTYRVQNFPNDREVTAFLHILLFNNTLVGGDCTVETPDKVRLPLDRRSIS